MNFVRNLIKSIECVCPALSLMIKNKLIFLLNKTRLQQSLGQKVLLRSLQGCATTLDWWHPLLTLTMTQTACRATKLRTSVLMTYA